MNKNYRVTLTDDERSQLQTLITTGKTAAQTQTHARMLLKAHQSAAGPSWSDQDISNALEVSIPTIERVRRTLVLEGLEAALQDQGPPRPPVGAHWMAHRKRISWRWCAVRHRPATIAGPCACWPITWSNSSMSTRSPTKPSGKR